MAHKLLVVISATFLMQAAVHGQWQPNVPAETRTLDEIYQAAQAEKCDQLRVAAGGDGERLPSTSARTTAHWVLQPKVTGPALSKDFKRDFPSSILILLLTSPNIMIRASIVPSMPVMRSTILLHCRRSKTSLAGKHKIVWYSTSLKTFRTL